MKTLKNIQRFILLIILFSVSTNQVYCFNWSDFNPFNWTPKISLAAVGLFSLISLRYYKSIKSAPAVADDQKLPIVYHPDYNITCGGLERLHPFDSAKYRRALDQITSQLQLTSQHFYQPDHKVTDKDLQEVHKPEYLNSLNSSSNIGQIVGIPMGFLPNFLLQWRLLNPMRWATQGTIDAAQLALKKGVGINLGGGYHHAKPDEGGGFCFFADIPLAIKKLRETQSDLAVMYVDLDAHQGNGVEYCMDNDPNWYTLDCYSENNYPGSFQKYPRQKINKPLTQQAIYCAECLTQYNDRVRGRPGPTRCENCNKAYLENLQQGLSDAFNEFKQKYHDQPKIMFYNAGTDCYVDDPLGLMKVTDQGIIDRDEFVFQTAKDNNIPICMTTSGGYTKKSAQLIGASIINLQRKKLLER